MAVLVEELVLADLSRRRPIEYLRLEINVKRNRVGSWTLEMPANERNWELIQLDNNGGLIPVGIVVDWNGVYTFSGHAESWSFSRALIEGRIVETLTLTGSDWLSLLANRIAYPNPAAAWTSQTITSTTYGPDPAETVIKTIVEANLVTAGDTNRRVPLLTIATDQGRGGNATYKVTTPNPDASSENATVAQSLMDMVRDVDLQSPILVRIDLGDGELVLDVTEPRDLTEKAVFSPLLGNLPEATLTVSDPTGNAALVQSKVSGANFSQSLGPGATNPWQRVEQYVDQAGTDTAEDVAKAAEETLAKGAGTIQLAVRTVDLPRLRFGADGDGVQGYREGDLVTVDLRDGVTYSDAIYQVQLVSERTGDAYTETVTPTVGDDGDQTEYSQRDKQLRRMEKALRGSI
jgi:hypothetical protein